jgi:hypothetical protein
MNAAAPRPTSRMSVDWFSFVVLGLVISTMLLATTAVGAAPALAVTLPFLAVVPLLERQHRVAVREMSFYLAVPILISAGQNIYLGLLSPSLTHEEIQTLLIVNFLLAAMFCVGLAIYGGRPNIIRTQAGWILLLTAGWAIVSFGLFGGEVHTALASLRNVLNPAMFAFLGAAVVSFVVPRRLMIYISLIALAVAAFGYYEIFVDPHVWVHLNISDLWIKKGLLINSVTGLPPNFYSSESIGSGVVRRMASTFADPVNLGTFLFLGFMTSWYLRWRWLSLVIFVAVGLTVSKGALLGLLVFWVVSSRHSRSAVSFPLVVSAAVAIGLAFIAYSLSHSTGSLVAHVHGFTGGFERLPAHPLGNGLGSTGSLAKIATSGLGATGVLAKIGSLEGQSVIAESGLGLIAAQLGIIGLGLFAWLCVVIHRGLSGLSGSRERVLGFTLLYAIVLNIAFNEVALSPNSSAGYFVILGLLAATGAMQRADRDGARSRDRELLASTRAEDSAGVEQASARRASAAL